MMEALYVQLRAVQAKEKLTTSDLGDGVFVDYDAKGHIVGVEILRPCKVTIDGKEVPGV